MLAKLRHQLRCARFKRKNLNIIEGIPFELADTILNKYILDGWELGREFDSPSSLHFQGKCLIHRGQSTLAFSYTKKHLGAIAGPARIVGALAHQFELTALCAPTLR